MGGVKIRRVGGAEGIRTPDPHNAIVVLYQLSYDPSPDNRREPSRRVLRVNRIVGRRVSPW